MRDADAELAAARDRRDRAGSVPLLGDRPREHRLRPAATRRREQVEHAARLAQAHEFIERLPDGYDTVIGERGITLSGGQRQRVAIARALVVDPRILILDDATASVDATTEAKIRVGLREAMRGRTTIIIAHRLSTIALADEIVVLDRRPHRRARHARRPDRRERRLPRDLRARPARARGRRRAGGGVAEVEEAACGSSSPAATSCSSASVKVAGLVVGADEAAADDALPARAARTGCAPRSRSSCCSARRPSRWRHRSSSGSRSTRSTAAATRTGSTWIVARSSPPGSSALALLVRADLLHRLDGRADARRPAQPPLPPPPAAVARLLRAQPRRRARSAGITNDVEALDQLVTDGVTSLVQNSLTLVGTAIILFILDWRLALATLTVVPLLMASATAVFRRQLVAQLPPRAREGSGSSPRRSPRTSPACASPGVHPRARERATTSRRESARYRAANHETVVQNGLYFPFVDLLSSIATAIVLGYGGYLRLRREHDGRRR